MSAQAQFRTTPSFPYECAIHTLEVHDERGNPYSAVLDLIRTGKNPRWGIGEDRLCLRAAVVDAAGRVVASQFTDAPADIFPRTVGAMHLLDESGRIAFRAARGPDGRMRDGDVDFEMSVSFLASTMIQRAAELQKAALELHLRERGVSASEEIPIELLVDDYPRTEHTGSILVKQPGRDEPLVLVANQAPSTVSHHYGNALPHYVFLASVRRPDHPSFIAVIARIGLDLHADRPGPEVRFPFGYLIRTDASGSSRVEPLHVELDEHDGHAIGGCLLGKAIHFEIATKAGQCLLNEGILPTWTGFGAAIIRGSQLLSALGLDEEERFERVLVDVAGSFVTAARLP